MGILHKALGTPAAVRLAISSSFLHAGWGCLCIVDLEIGHEKTGKEATR